MRAECYLPVDGPAGTRVATVRAPNRDVCPLALWGSARPMRMPSRSVFRRVLAAGAAVAFSALVAAGCGGGGSDGGSGETGLVGDEGPLAWLPTDTWLIASANLDPKAIDTAVTSLDRLPIWALAEGFLPASDGTGLRRELLKLLAKESGKDGGKPTVTATELETAFGDRVGMAITSADFEKMDGDDVPIVAWVEVDDEDAALATAKDFFEGTDTEEEHEGVTYFNSKQEEATFLVRDGLLVVSSSPKQMESLIDVREGDDSLAGDDVAEAVLEVGVGDALAGFAVASEPLLAAAPELVRSEADDIDEDGEASTESKENAEQAAKIADELGPLLESNAVDGLIADWISGSVTIDESGLRITGAWSNPRDLATPDPGSRELVERGPAESQYVTATASDGSTLRRVQDAWSEVRDAYDLDLRAMVAEACSQADRWACDLGVELALAVLEDEDLADSLEEQGDVAMALFQDTSPQVEALGAISKTGKAPANTKLESRLFEAVSSASTFEGYEPPAELLQAAKAAGIQVTTAADGRSMTLRVASGSPIARLVQEEFDPNGLAALASVGFDLRQLLSPAGLTLTREEVDGLYVWGFPPDAPSKVVPALEGDAENLADDETYQEVIKAAKPPKEVGTYGWVNLQSYVESTLAALSADADGGGDDIKRIIPTVRNNLADVPGIVTWSTREESDGEDVGVFEMAMPILE